MEKHIYDEKNGLWYELQGDYYIPCLELPDEEQCPSAFGGNGICDISGSTERRSIRSCSSQAN